MKVGFDETFAPGQIDFSGEALEQASPLHAVGTAELLAHSDGEIRIRGRYTVEMTAECDRCLGRARYPMDARFDLFYRSASRIAREEEVSIDESEAEIARYLSHRYLSTRDCTSRASTAQSWYGLALCFARNPSKRN